MMNSKTIDTEVDILLRAEYLLANHKWYSVYEFMAGLTVLLFPQKEYILSHANEFKVVHFLLDMANVWTADIVDFGGSYSEKQQLNFFCDRFCHRTSIDRARQFARCFVVIDSVDDNGAISFKREWLNIFCSSWGIPMDELTKDSNSLISENAPINNIAANELVDDSSVEVVSDVRKSVAKSDAESRLEKFWFSITNGNFDYRYLWRNKLSRDDYEELRNRLSECIYEQRPGFVKRFAKSILLYVAEWYKRSYNGNDGNDNAIKDLNLQCRPEEIWKNAGVPNNFLYKKKNNMYLFSMYVLGGLPIKYLVNKRFTDIFKEIANAYKQKEEEEKLDKNVFINNFALQESTRSQWGSLHLFFEALMRDDYPFSEQDMLEEPFKTFVDNLQEWNPMRKKFGYEWIIEGNLRNSKIRRMFRLYVNPENDGERNKSISYDRMTKWGVLTSIKSFNLYICFNDSEPEELEENAEHVTFYNTYDGYFVGQMSSHYFTFKKIPAIKISKIKLVGKFGHRFKFVHCFDILPYVQLYETERYSMLSSKRSDRKNYVLLPYSYKILVPKNESSERKFLTENGEAYRMVENTNFVSFEDEEGETITLSAHINAIDVSIKKYSKVFAYEEGMVTRRYVNDLSEWQEEKLPLLFSLSDIKVSKCLENQEPEVLSSGSYRVEFKKEEDFLYQEWTNKNSPLQGVVKLRVITPGYQSVLKVYVVPSSECPIRRDCVKKRIGIDRSVDIVDVPMAFAKSEYIKGKEIKWYRELVTDEYNVSQKVIKVGTSDDYVLLPIFRAWEIKDLYKNGKLINSYPAHLANYPLSIPFLLKNNFSVRYIGDDGAFYLDLKEEIVNNLDFAFEDDYDSMYNTVEHDTPVGTIEYYFCKRCDFRGKNLYIGQSGLSDYKFYYWSMSENEEPELLDSSNDDGFLQLRLSEKHQERGIIFQGLDESDSPRFYCSPKVIGHWGKVSDTLTLKCVLVAIRYHVPFRCFEPIYDLLKHTDSDLTDLAARVLMLKSDVSVTERLEGLVRFSHEFYFSWPLLNRLTWKQMPDRVLKEYFGSVMGYLQDYEKKEYVLMLRRNAERLFVKCGQEFSEENLVALEHFAKVYWSYKDEVGAHFVAFGDNRWYGYSSNGDKRLGYNDKDMAVKAVTFMRPRPVNNTIHVRRENGKDGYEAKHPQIVGFTIQENKRNPKDDDVVRPIGDIIAFLKWLRMDNESFISIERFLKQNLYEYKN